MRLVPNAAGALPAVRKRLWRPGARSSRRTTGTTFRGSTSGRSIRVFADSREDRRIGEELRRYFQENAWFRDWLQRVNAIVVDGGVIAVATDLGRGRRGLRIARLVCTMVRDTRLWSPARDHAMYGRNDVRLRSC